MIHTYCLTGLRPYAYIIIGGGRVNIVRYLMTHQNTCYHLYHVMVYSYTYDIHT
jgi:hypothetical protein